MQYLSWRIWFLKRRAAAVQRSHHDQAYLQEEDSGPTGVASPGYSSDEDQPRGPAEPRTSRLSHDSRTTSDGRGLAASTAGPSEGDLEDRLRRLSVKIAPERSMDDVAATPEATPLATAEPRRFDRLYVVMISLHGLVRGDRMELGKDSDTGGQVKYVVELAKAMALHPAVHRVDLLTRLIRCEGSERVGGRGGEEAGGEADVWSLIDSRKKERRVSRVAGGESRPTVSLKGRSMGEGEGMVAVPAIER